MDYIFLISSAILFAVSFCFDNIYQEKCGTSAYAGFKYNMYIGLMGTILFLIVNGFRCSFTWYSVIFAFLAAFAVAAYKIVGMKIMQEGSMAIYTIFLMSGGMIVPYLWGILFLGETITINNIAGLLILTIAVVLSYYSKEGFTKKQLFLCVLVFLLNGMSAVVGKLHQIEKVYPIVNTTDFSIISNLMRFLLSGILLLPFKKEENTYVEMKKIFPVIIFSAIAGGVAELFNLLCAISVPATVLYPVLTGGTIMFSVIASRIFFKEKITGKVLLGIILCFVGSALFV